MEFGRFEFNNGTIDKTSKSNIVTIPEEINGVPVLEIGENAFANMNLSNVILSDKVDTIQAGAFAGNSIRELVLPKGLRVLKPFAFYNNELVKVTFKNGIERIEENAFAENMRLESLVIPPTVNFISGEAFNDTNGYFKFICVRNSYAHLYAKETATPVELMELEEFLNLYA